ncbi:MAG: hypothetical protein JRI25_22615 [Deltaproteobacteria bacterium]|nr:hypothetical protein [Deltaproteobacteria bacterium]MBW2257369.1 hypothetical protein [Deltaproteobacteria bacterium]
MRRMWTAALLLLALPAQAEDPNLDLLPMALDLAAWQASADSGALEELQLYPQGTGAPGNYGLLDIGAPNNGIHDVVRQILEGISAEDLSYHDGQLEMDDNGELFLPGNPGMSAVIAGALMEIVDEPRIIALYSEVTDAGANSLYTIVGFGAVRVVDVDLTGPEKAVIIERASIR